MLLPQHELIFVLLILVYICNHRTIQSCCYYKLFREIKLQRILSALLVLCRCLLNFYSRGKQSCIRLLGGLLGWLWENLLIEWGRRGNLIFLCSNPPSWVLVPRFAIGLLLSLNNKSRSRAVFLILHSPSPLSIWFIRILVSFRGTTAPPILLYCPTTLWTLTRPCRSLRSILGLIILIPALLGATPILLRPPPIWLILISSLRILTLISLIPTGTHFQKLFKICIKMNIRS